MKRHSSALAPFRSRWAAGVQVFATMCLILQPLGLQSEWVDTDSDSVLDSWNDGSTLHSLSTLDATSQDIDSDNAYNSEELQYGSNPFVLDTDGDGLDDGTEIHVAIQSAGKNYSLTNWDSNSDLVSDHDDFYNFFGVSYPGGQLPSFSGATYSDYDGDGVKNPFDSHPGDPSLRTDWNGNGINDDQDTDGDGHLDENDSNPTNNALWNDWNGNGLNDDQEANPDSDGDGYADGNDSDPGNAALWSDWNHNGTNDDQEDPDSDGDGYTDGNDSDPGNNALWSDWNHNGINNDQDVDGDGHPCETDSHPANNALWSDWNGNGTNDELDDYDGDGHLDTADSDSANNLLWSDWNHNGINDDLNTDGDGYPDENDSHPLNNALWDDWNDNGINDSHDSDLDSHPDETDSHPSNPALWSDWDLNGTNEGQDTDNDGYIDDVDSHPGNANLWSDWNNNGTNDTPEEYVDTDGDGYYDWQDTSPADPALYTDWDGDLLNANVEVAFQSDPHDPDSDDDGLDDKQEYNAGTNPNAIDTDLDDLTDGEEVNVYGTLPTNKFSISEQRGWQQLYTDWQLVDLTDTDLDGIPNRVEDHYDLNPALAADAGHDRDGNGINNVTQYNMGIALDADLTRYDEDGDGMSDVFEDYYELDKEIFNDAVEDADGDGVLNHEEMVLVLSPLDGDTYNIGNSLGDLQVLMASELYLGSSTPPTADGDQDGIPDWAEAVLTTPAAPNYYHFTRMAAGDLDGDGMPDVWEHRYKLDLRSAIDAGRDQEPDGLTNLTEFRFNTHPWAGTGDAASFYNPQNPGAPTGGGLSYVPPPVAGFVSSGQAGIFGFNDPASVDPQVEPKIEYHYQRVSHVHEPGYNYVDFPDPEWPEMNQTDIGRMSGNYSSEYEPVRPPPDPGSCQCAIDGEASCTCPPEESLWDWDYVIDEYGNYVLDEYGDRIAYPGSYHIVGSTGGCFCGVWEKPRWEENSMKIRVSLEEPVPNTQESEEFTFVVEQAETTGHNNWTQIGAELTLTIESGESSAEIETEKAPQGRTRRVRMIGGGAPAPKGSLSLQDMAGPRYRKIGLNGQPMPDSKPQVQSENGEQPEETYVDAYTRQLRHSVSDVYSTMDSTLIPLMVRRDVNPEAFSNTSGLRPHERPDMPFGAGWRSNICAYVRIETHGPTSKAQVIDEMGASQSYVATSAGFLRTREENADAKTRFDTLVYTADGQGHAKFILTKKFGTTCTYEQVPLVQELAQDRINSSDQTFTYGYARLTEVVDRWGNRLFYSYDDTTEAGRSSLIPKSIHDPARPNHQIWIKQYYGLVTEVRGPAGDTTSYYYASVTQPLPLPQTNLPVLIGTVRRPAGEDPAEGEEGGILGNKPLAQTVTIAQQLDFSDALYAGLPDGAVRYAYQFKEEADLNPSQAPCPTAYLHVELGGIQDERGGIYAFHRILNETCEYITWGDMGTELRRQHGLPMLMSKITLPNASENQDVNFSGLRPIHVTPIEALQGDIVTTVTGPAGEYTYTFSEAEILRPADELAPTADASAYTVLMAFKRMEIATGGESEIFTFNPRASMALASATDMSGNRSSFYYARDEVPVTVEAQIDWTAMGDNAENSPGGDQLFDDPIVEQNALGHFKVFSYNQATRILDSVTDERGVKTAYQVDGLGRRTSETVTGPHGDGRLTTYEYGWLDDDNQPKFPGFATKVVTKSTPEGTMPATVTVTLRTPDANGRVKTETVGTVTAGEFEAIAETTTFYDHNGNKRTVMDGRGLLTNFNYDGKHRLTGVTFPDGNSKSLEYDDHGNVEKEVNENGVATFHVYDEFNRRTKTTVDLNGSGEAEGRYTGITYASTGAPIYDGDLVTETEYNARNQPLTAIDPRGVTTTHVYDFLGRLESKTTGGLTTQFRYFDNFGGSIFDLSGFKAEEVEDARGVVTRNTYDGLYRTTMTTVRLAGETAALSSVFTDYDEGGNPIKQTDGLGRETTTVFDNFGQAVSVTHPDGTSAQSFYTHTGKVWKTINELGAVTVTDYDAAGRAVKVTAPAVDGVSAVTKMVYDAAGNAVQQEDALGRFVVTEYDARNRPWRVTAPPVWDADNGGFVRPVTETVYDAVGQVTQVTDPAGNPTSKHYDRAGRVWKVVDALGNAAKSSHDANGNVLTVTDALGRTVTNTYDNLNRLTKTVDGAGIENEFGYDAAGNRTSVKDGLDQETTFVYDGLNRLTSQTFANGDTTTFVHNELQKVSQTDAKGVTTSYTYDARNRLLTVTAPGLARTCEYDDGGRLVSVTEAGKPEAAVAYAYDDLGRVVTESSRGVVHAYGYDVAGNRTSATYGTGRTVLTSYDALNRPETIAEGGRLTRYGYDLVGRAVLMISGNGQVTENVHDEAGRLKNRTLFRNLGDRTETGVMAEFGWLHDAAGNVERQDEVWYGTNARSRITVMTYDDANRLESEEVAETGAQTVTTTYGYDDGNNRTGKAVTASGTGTLGSEVGHWTYTYNEANQLILTEKRATAGGAVLETNGYQYDANGNRTNLLGGLHEGEVPADVSNQGLTYTAATTGAAGNNLRVNLQGGASGESQGVAVNGNDVNVTLARAAGTPAQGVDQGITYTAATGGVAGNSLRVNLQGGASGQSLAVAVTGNDVNVTLARAEGTPAQGIDQGLTYTAATAGVAGNNLRVNLQGGGANASLGVAVAGNAVNVTLARAGATPAQGVDQGITYTAVDPGAAGNALHVMLQKGEVESDAGVQVAGNNVYVTLATDSGVMGTLDNQGITYTETVPGSGATVAVEAPSQADQTAWVQQGLQTIIHLGSDEGDPATLEAGGLRVTAKTAGTAGNNIRLYLRDENDPVVTSDGNGPVISYTLVDDNNGGYSTTAEAVAIWINNDEAASALVTAEAVGSISVVPPTNLSGGGENFEALPLLASEAVAMMLPSIVTATLSGEDGVLVPQAALGMIGGVPVEVLSTADDIVALLDASSEVGELMTVAGGGTELLSPTDTYLEAGDDGDIVSTASQVAALLSADSAVSALMTVSGTGSQALVETASPVALSGGAEGAITSTASQVAALLSGDSAVGALMTVSGTGSQALAATASPLALSGGGIEVIPAHTTTYTWDAQDRLVGVTMPDGKAYNYKYDYRTRRIGTHQAATGGNSEKHTAIVFGGGLSLAEYDSATSQTTIADPQLSTVHYLRGPDMGGGVGGMLYSLRGGATKYSLSNGRGDIVAQSNQAAELTWTASYEAYGKRTKETGSNADKQRANSKDEDPTGLTNEGFRYRDLETGMFISRDPAGFVDGPNVYAYVKQNPWTSFDPDGLQASPTMLPWLRPAARVGTELGESSVRVAPRPQALAPKLDPPAAVMPNPDAGSKGDSSPANIPNPRLSPTTSQRTTRENNKNIIWIQNTFEQGSERSNELHEFVGRWNQEIYIRGGSMTTRTPTKADQNVKQGFQDRERDRDRALYAGKVVGHIPDVVAGGNPSGPFMPLDGRVNSSIGRQVQIINDRAGPKGFTYNEVRIIPNPPPPPPPPRDRESMMRFASR